MAREIVIPEQFKGGEVAETAIDSYAFEGRRFGVAPLRESYERDYGERGVDWDVVERLPRDQPEMLAYNMGSSILQLVVRPGIEIPTQRGLAD